MKRYENIVVQESHYPADNLQETLTKYGNRGFKLVNTLMATGKYGIEVMYLFFTRESDEYI